MAQYAFALQHSNFTLAAAGSFYKGAQLQSEVDLKKDKTRFSFFKDRMAQQQQQLLAGSGAGSQGHLA